MHACDIHPLLFHQVLLLPSITFTNIFILCSIWAERLTDFSSMEDLCQITCTQLLIIHFGMSVLIFNKHFNL